VNASAREKEVLAGPNWERKGRKRDIKEACCRHKRGGRGVFQCFKSPEGRDHPYSSGGGGFLDYFLNTTGKKTAFGEFAQSA